MNHSHTIKENNDKLYHKLESYGVGGVRNSGTSSLLIFSSFDYTGKYLVKGEISFPEEETVISDVSWTTKPHNHLCSNTLFNKNIISEFDSYNASEDDNYFGKKTNWWNEFKRTAKVNEFDIDKNYNEFTINNWNFDKTNNSKEIIETTDRNEAAGIYINVWKMNDES